ncbi:MAG: DNA recombination protein RmuC [Chitinophagales bacterium]|nr:DNA recombination protein RmuC [Chitinophagales bacterium]
MEILYLVIGLFVGFGIGFLFLKNKSAAEAGKVAVEKGAAEQRANDLFQQKSKLEDERSIQDQKILELTSELASAKKDLENLVLRLSEQKAETEKLQEKFATEFQNLANKIFEEKGKSFAEQNQKNLDQLLKPFQDKIKDFEKKVEEAYDKELRDKISLREEVKKLYDLNSRISQEANNLTKALRGDTKKQGNWGETILERILEQSGLKKGTEYETQFVTTNQDGASIKPDVVVFLPDNKHLIIDAKVSLTAYDRYVNSEEDTEREQFLRDHINSVRSHVKLLSEKNYYTGEGLRSPDFVLLFMPIESSFSLAVQNDNDLFHFAWEKRIVIVSPTTLLATLTTVASLWKIENQNKNALEIARLSGAMYDKLEGVIAELIKVGNSIQTTDAQYKSAMSKLYEGQGNVVKTAEKIKALGAKASKSIPQSLIDRADD